LFGGIEKFKSTQTGNNIRIRVSVKMSLMIRLWLGWDKVFLPIVGVIYIPVKSQKINF